jgi:hypothetical protein
MDFKLLKFTSIILSMWKTDAKLDVSIFNTVFLNYQITYQSVKVYFAGYKYKYWAFYSWNEVELNWNVLQLMWIEKFKMKVTCYMIVYSIVIAIFMEHKKNFLKTNKIKSFLVYINF